MGRVDEVKWEKAAAALRARLTRLSEACLRINWPVDEPCDSPLGCNGDNIDE